MKTFRTFKMVRQPLDAVWATMRDRLGEVAAAMEDLEGIESLERVSAPGELRLLNRWNVRQKVPAMLRASLGGDTIAWLDRAIWREERMACEWSIEPLLLTGQIECAGTTFYESAMGGRGTRVTFEGYFDLKPGFAKMLPAALEPAVGSFVESIVTTVIPRNLARAILAAADLIESERPHLAESAAAASALNQPIR